MSEDDFTSSNIVMNSYFSEKLNLASIYELFTILPINYTLNSKKNSRDKMPYFGFEDVFVSISYCGERRGVRKGGGQIKNAVCVDLQHSEKNIHIKIYETNFLLLGILNEEMGEYSSLLCLNHIKMINDLYIEYKNLTSVEKDETKKWVLNALKNDENLNMFNEDKILEDFTNLQENPLENVNYNVAKFLSMFTYDYPTYELFIEKLEAIENIENKCFEIKPEFLKFNINNNIFNYKLDAEIPMIFLTKELLKIGFGVLYNNWFEPNTLYIMVPLSILSNKKETNEIINLIQNNDRDIKKLKKNMKSLNIKAHRFQVNKVGSIRQTSPTPKKEALNVRNLVLKHIFEILKLKK